MGECVHSMAILHSWQPHLLHRNLSSRVFLMKPGRARSMQQQFEIEITNLSLAYFAEGPAPKPSHWSEPEYCPPECADLTGEYTEQADVYSFSMVMWEIAWRFCTGRYATPKDAINSQPNTPGHRRPPLPVNCTAKLKELIEACWAPVPCRRPSFGDLALHLRECHEELKC